jgi:hypothetical protein
MWDSRFSCRWLFSGRKNVRFQILTSVIIFWKKECEIPDSHVGDYLLQERMWDSRFSRRWLSSARKNVIFQILTSVIFFRNVSSCSLVEFHRRFGGFYYFHQNKTKQVDMQRTPTYSAFLLLSLLSDSKMEAECLCFEASANFCQITRRRIAEIVLFKKKVDTRCRKMCYCNLKFISTE